MTFVACARESASPAPAADGVLWNVEVSAKMTFSPDTFSCAPGQRVRVRVTNTVPIHGAEITHTFVLLQSTVDVEAFGREAIDARAENSYIPERFLPQVLAHTPLLRPGESAELEFTAPIQPGTYPVVCAFPGHCIIGMRGQLVVR